MVTRDELKQLCANFSRAAADDVLPQLKRAAVAIVVIEGGDKSSGPVFLLTRRTWRLSSHGGQFALPGGRCDEGETAIDTALRELHEEVGLQLDSRNVLGTLDDYPTRSGYLITPVVLWGGGAPRLTPNPKEVARVHFVPLSEITRPGAVQFVTIPESDRQVVRVFMAGTHVHAPTAAVVYQFAELLAGRTTRVADLEQPVFAWR